MTDDVSIRVDSEEYVVGRDGGDLRVDRRVDGDVTRLDTLNTELLPGPAREALERGDTDDQALLTALGGVVQAEVQRHS